MMAIPVVMALGAGWATGTMAGAAIGWMIGSWIYSSQTKSKNDTSDPAIAQAPKFNSAIRGMVIPILFGTNRVASQIPWQNNFQAIRSDSNGSGGGKFGGSGMGGKGGSKSGSGSYTYKMDAIYHLGIPDQPVSLLTAWIGSDKVDPQSLLAITRSASLTGFGGLLELTGVVDGSLFSNTTTPNTISLHFDGAVFFPGNSPDEPNTWPYFTSVIGQPVRFPSSCWVGFQGLNLGSTASMPQISWEVGPGAEDFNFNSQFVSHSTDADGPFYNYGHQALDSTGVHVVANTSLIRAYNHDSSVAWSWSIAAFVTALEANRALVGWAGSGASFNCVANVINGKYLLISINSTATDIGTIAAMIVCTPNVGAVPTINGAVRYIRSGLDPAPITATQQLDLAGHQRDTDTIMMRGNVGIGATATTFILFPPIADIIAGTYFVPRTVGSIHWAQDEVDYIIYVIGNFNVDAPNALYSYNTGPHGFLLPSIGALGAVNTNAYFYLSRGIMDNADAYIAANIKPTYPLGAMVKIPLGDMTYTSITATIVGTKSKEVDISSSTFVVANANFTQTSGGQDTGVTTLPWTEEYKNFDGTVSANNLSQYGLKPYVFQFTNGAFLIIFTQINGLDTAITLDGLYPLQIRAFVYNPLKELFQQIAHEGGFIFANSDWGVVTKFGLSAATVDLDVNQTTQVITVWGDNGATGLDNGIGNGDHWVAQAGTLILNGGADVYPPYIIRQILTNPIYSPFGSLLTISDIDNDSYTFAIDYCAAQGIQVSTQYRNEENVLTTIELLLALYGGYLTISGGLIKFGVIEATATPVRVIDNSHLLVDDVGKPPVTTTRGAKQDTFNLIRVNYIDRLLDYNQEQIEEGDEVDQDLYGIRLKEFPPQFVMTESLARTLALRTLWSNLFVRDSHAFKLGWKDADLEPGDVITLVDSISVPPLNQNVRIVKWQEEKRGRFSVQAVQELGYAMTAVGSLFNQSSLSVFSALGVQPKPKFVTIYELPGTLGSEPTVFVGWVPDAFAAGATLYASGDNTTYAPVARAAPYPIAGTLLSALDNNQDEIWTPNVNIALFPSSGFTTNSPTFDLKQTLNDVGYVDMHYGAGLLWVGSEMIAYTGVNLVGQNQYQLAKVFRGWGGTKIQNHNSGDFFIQQGAGIFSQSYTEDRIGTKLWVKVAPFGQNGVEYPVSSINGIPYTIQGAWFKPQNPSAIQFQNNRGLTKLFVGSTIDIAVAWQDTARRAGFGMGGFGTGAQGFGAFVTDTLSHSWRIEVVGSSGLVVRSTVVSTVNFTYTSSQNAADNGAWRGNVAFKVTPFSPYGDSPRTSVISMSLF